jgi:hypothetical protein
VKYNTLIVIIGSRSKAMKNNKEVEKVKYNYRTNKEKNTDAFAILC